MKFQRGFFLAMILALLAFVASCTLHPLGSKKLSEDSMEQIVERVTNKEEVRRLLGVPIEAKILDEMVLANELNQTFLGRNIEERSIIIMNSSEIVIGKFYVKNGELIE